MLLKNDNQIIRVLKSHGNKALVIDCIKRTMPKWVEDDFLSNFDDCGEDEMFERTDYPFEKFKKQEKAIMYDPIPTDKPLPQKNPKSMDYER